MAANQSAQGSKPFSSIPFFFGLLLFVFAFMLFVNTKMPLVGEDFTNQEWNYQAAPATFAGKVDVVVQRAVSLGQYWSPRLGEYLATMISVFPKVVFNVINSLVFVWLLVVLFSLAYGRFPSPSSLDDLFSLFLIFALIIGLFPLFGQVFIWKSGATNYNWGLTTIMTFMIPFRFNLERKINLDHWGKFVGACLLGFLAGISMENTSPAVFALLAAYFIYAVIKKSIDWKWVFPLAANGLGVAYLLFSPGTSAKIQVYAVQKFDGNLTGIQLYLNRFLRIGSDFVRFPYHLHLALGLCLAAFVLYLLFRRKSLLSVFQQNKTRWYAMAAIFAASLIAALILISVPYQGDQKRSFSLFWFMEILSIALMVAWVRKDLPKVLSIGVVVLVGILLAYKMSQIAAVYTQFARQNDARVQVIDTALKTGQKVVTLPPITLPDSRILETREILNDLGERYANYYGFDQVLIEK